MWNLCRTAALQALKRSHHAPTIAARMPLKTTSVARLPLIQQIASFSSSSSSTDFDGILPMDEILSRTTDDLFRELGKKQFNQLQEAVARHAQRKLDAANTSSLMAGDVIELFTAAQHTRQALTMMRTFDFMQQHYPDDIDFIMYGEVFRLLVRERNGAKLWSIYEFARPRFEPLVPELIYRFGVLGKIEMRDMAGAQAVVDEMKTVGLEVSNEIYSHMIYSYARERNHEAVLANVALVDPQLGTWHGSAIDRVILSLGMVGEPERAFEFYVNSSMRLNGGTLITLLSVCRHNNCRQQASDILANRKRFDLELDARGYNAILETLIFLDRRNELESVLEEMTNESVKFDTRTKLIVDQNQDVLSGSYFKPTTSKKKLSKQDASTTTATKKKPFMTKPVIQTHMLNGRHDEAAALVDEFVSKVRPEDVSDALKEDGREVAIPSGAIRVPNVIAREAVQAYFGAGQHDKVRHLLDGYSIMDASKGSGVALMTILNLYAKKTKSADHAIAHRAAKLMVAQHVPMYRSDQAMAMFREFHDGDGALAMWEATLDAYIKWKNGQPTTDKSTDDDDDAAVVANEPRFQMNDPFMARRLKETVTVLAGANRVDDVFHVVDRTIERGVRLGRNCFVTLLTNMRPHFMYELTGKGVVVKREGHKDLPFYYTSDDVARVLDAMEERQIPIKRGHVANACIALAGGSKSQRLLLLELWAAIADTKDDSYKMPPTAFSVLLNVASRDASVEDVRRIYDQAREVYPSPERSILRDWETLLITKMAQDGSLDEAVERLFAMPQNAGRYTYEAVIGVLRSAATARRTDQIDKLLVLFEERDFRLTFKDAYDLVHMARDHSLPVLAFEVIRLYERVHGRSTSAVLDHASKTHQTHRDKFAVKKLRTMYRTALKLCEQTGEWRLALSLNTKVTELLGPELDANADQNQKDKQ